MAAPTYLQVCTRERLRDVRRCERGKFSLHCLQNLAKLGIFRKVDLFGGVIHDIKQARVRVRAHHAAVASATACLAHAVYAVERFVDWQQACIVPMCMQRRVE